MEGDDPPLDRTPSINHHRVLDAEMSVDELAEWLIRADRRYREEDPELSWPKVYAA